MKMKKYQVLFFTLFLAGLMACMWIAPKKGCISASATETSDVAAQEKDTKVKPKEVNYETLWLKVDANENKNVYYSDKSKKVWYEAKSMTETSGGVQTTYYYIDISWVSATSNSVINLKGDDDEIVSLTLPARESKFKAKFNKVTGEIEFDNVPSDINGVKCDSFEWRKATSYTWTKVTFEDAKKEDSTFRQEIEKMRISGASIYVRLPQTIGEEKKREGTDSETVIEFNVGARQSKEIKISITKRATAPKVTIDGTKLLLNTKDTMEYFIEGQKGTDWTPAEAKMPISKIASQALYTTSNTTKPTSVTILIRTKETTKKAYSKSFVLTIPAQRAAPSVITVAGGNANSSTNANQQDVICSYDDSKFYMNFTNASKTEPYEYLVVKPGTTTPDLTKGWKAVTSTKTISLSSKTAQKGSTIYIRKKMVKATTKTEFAIASAYATVDVNYLSPTSTPIPTK